MSTILSALNSLEKALQAEGKSPNTIRAYTSDVQHFNMNLPPSYSVDMWDDSAIFDRAVQFYIQTIRPHTPASTLNRRLASIRMMARVLGFPRPLDGFKMPRVGTRPAHPLPGGMVDIKAMLEKATLETHKALIVLCGGCGARVSEARGVRPCDLTIVNGQPYVKLFGKGMKERTVPIPPLAWDVLLQFYIGPMHGYGSEPSVFNSPIIPLSDKHCRRTITELGRRAGISRPVASHDLRMTFGTAVYGSSKDIRATQELLGHASSLTTEGYTQVSDNAKLEAIKGVA